VLFRSANEREIIKKELGRVQKDARVLSRNSPEDTKENQELLVWIKGYGSDTSSTFQFYLY
jgi:hypothetical protein